MTRKTVMAGVAAALMALSVSPSANAQSYTVNGQYVGPQLEAQMMAAGLPAGHYWYDAASGSYGLMGSTAVLGNVYAGAYANPGVMGSSGQIYNNGSWIHTSPLIDGSVGGDGQGCYYVGDWSNC